MMKCAPLFLSGLALILAGCAGTGPIRLFYDEERAYFLTHPTDVHQPPRLKDGSLVGYDNLADFSEERQVPDYHRKNDYRWAEDTTLQKASDFKLGQLYDAIRLRFEADDPNAVFGLAAAIRAIHPGADWFSNLSYLEGRAFERLGLDTEARTKYTDFLTYSARLLPARHRGAWAADPGDSLYLLQRLHARGVLEGYLFEAPAPLPPCPPRYAYQPNQPGFPEQRWYLNQHNLHLIYFFDRSLGNQLGAGLQVGYRFSPAIKAFFEVSASPQTVALRMGVPLQLYQAPNDRFGVKLTPFVSFNSIDSLKLSHTTERLSGRYLDGGLRLSAGWYLLPTLSIGAYGEYYLRNRQHPWVSPQGVSLYTPNEFDVSVYYGFLEYAALKAGVKNEHIVVGLYMAGWELSWSLNKNQLMLRHSLD